MHLIFEKGLSLFAYVIARCDVNSVGMIRNDQFVIYHKKRRWYGEFVILMGNYLFQSLQVDVAFLNNKQWCQREKEMHALLYAEKIFVQRPEGIFMPKRKGILLADILESPHYSWGEKCAAMIGCIQALKQLHEKRFCQCPLSHGDATVRNVVYDPSTKMAQWFDFETEHSDRRTHSWRCADDLRACIFTAAKYIHECDLECMVLKIAEAYDNKHILQLMLNELTHITYRPRIFHMAQMRMNHQRYQKVRHIVLNIMNEFLQSELGGADDSSRTAHFT